MPNLYYHRRKNEKKKLEIDNSVCCLWMNTEMLPLWFKLSGICILFLWIWIHIIPGFLELFFLCLFEPLPPFERGKRNLFLCAKAPVLYVLKVDQNWCNKILNVFLDHQICCNSVVCFQEKNGLVISYCLC